ncbi:MAG: hypothetical protein IKJ38_06460 [Alistipes sp.]|nr:hypothetical protein [Alistipes sp.]
MKRYICIVALLLGGVLSLGAQEFEVLKNINGNLRYSDEKGEWLSRKAWLEKYSRKEFRQHFGDGSRYDHSEEVNFLRNDIQESVKLLGEGNIVWERVVETEAPREELILAARKRMASVIYESQDMIVGGIIEHGFIRDEMGRPWGIKHAHWKGIVTYEFKEGRYKVSVSHIQYKAERGSSLGIYSLGFSTEKAYAPFANLLYPYSHKAGSYRYYRLVDFIDYNFTTTFILFDTALKSNNW